MKKSRIILVIGGLLFLLLVIAASGERSARSNKLRSYKKEETKFGAFYSLSVESAPFPHKSRAKGYEAEEAYYPVQPHYASSTVKVFVPRGFLPKKYVDLVFFFHGWYSSVEDAENTFELSRQFAASGLNALLVLPETGRYVPDSAGGKLEEKGGFERLVRDILDGLSSKGVLAGARPGRILLAGHSGGYRVIARILELGDLESHIEEVYLFDALFGGLDKFSDWVLGGRGRFVSVYSVSGDTLKNSDKFIALLKSQGLPVSGAGDNEGKTDRVLRSRIVFLRSSGNHYGVVYKNEQFERLLASSGIGNPPMR